MVIKMKSRNKDYIPIFTIFKIFLMFTLILILKLNINLLILNFLLVISTIEILATNYRKTKIKWILILSQLYTMMLYIPVININNPRLLVNGLVYIIIIFIIIIIDLYIYIKDIWGADRNGEI